jgi:hypothetical protein
MATATLEAATPSPTPTPPAVAPDPVSPQVFHIAPPADLPAGATFYIGEGCVSCDGGFRSFARVTRPPGGKVSVDEIPPVPGAVGGPLSLAVGSDGHEMYATACTRGQCGFLGTPSADAESTIFHSIDAGESWSPVDAVAGNAIVWRTPAGWWLQHAHAGSTSASWVFDFSAYPGGPHYPQPAGARAAWTVPGLGLTWRGTDAFTTYAATGDVLLDGTLRSQIAAPIDAGLGLFVSGAAPGGALLASWIQDGLLHYGLVDDGKLSGVRAVPRAGISISVAAWDSATSGYGNVTLREADVPGAPIASNATLDYSVPAHVDFATGEIVPLKLAGEYFGPGYLGQRNEILAMVAP